MKKMININFQGRIIPIEETAYETLKQYVESLRRYFMNEEGRDEIINDIESRIAELFNNRLKNGAVCITDDDVTAVIGSIGRPQDFEEQSGGTSAGASNTTSAQQAPFSYSGNNGRLVRNSDDKIIAGVCSGLANSMRIDPVIMRILFVVFFGFAFWIYLVLWIVVPAQSIKTNITKRLYRNRENKAIAGVCSGLASYFKVDIWIPRLIFALPLLISIFDGAFGNHGFNFDFFPHVGFISGSLFSSFLFIYIVLWIVLPEATTTSEKLELRGERIDLNSIRETVKEDLQGVKGRAQQFGEEVKQTAEQLGDKAKVMMADAGQAARSFTAEAAPAVRNTGSGLGHVIGVLLKIFLFIIIGSMAVALLGILVALFAGGLTLMPLKGYILEGSGQNLLAWASLLLFIGIPILAFIVWIIRRIAGVKTKSHYLGYAFTALWLAGLFCFIGLVAGVSNSFRYPAKTEQTFNLSKPQAEKIVVKVSKSSTHYYGGWWNSREFPFGVSDDSLLLRNVQLEISKSQDQDFHVLTNKYSNGPSGKLAEDYANAIAFNITQQDSVLYLDNGFRIQRGSKFRNQHLVVKVQVPVGKRIFIDKSVSRKYDHFNISFGRRRNWDWDRDNDEEWDSDYRWDDNVEYIMTNGGLEKVKNLDEKELKNGNFKLKIDKDGNVEAEGSIDDKEEYRYRYKQIEDSIKEKATEKIREELRVKDSVEREKKLKDLLKKTTKSREEEESNTLEESVSMYQLLSPFAVFSSK
jgi:phage shock protein PspC (stress-responsive transcriptional regulator)